MLHFNREEYVSLADLFREETSFPSRRRRSADAVWSAGGCLGHRRGSLRCGGPGAIRGERYRRLGPRLEMEEVVVTETRTEKKLLEAPVKTEVVTREEIERTQCLGSQGGAGDVPGLILREIHGKQGQAVWMQGFDADRVLILLNDERLTATTGSSVDLTPDRRRRH